AQGPGVLQRLSGGVPPHRRAVAPGVRCAGYEFQATRCNAGTSPMNDDKKFDANGKPIVVAAGVGAAGGAVTGAVVGAAVGGPIGAIVGGAAGAASGAVVGETAAKVNTPST